ncbi:Ada metal-binding domain-containing protein, partial [Paraburkholderia sp.]
MNRTVRTDTGSETAVGTPHWATDAERWEAVTRREPQADGAFFYAVKT